MNSNEAHNKLVKRYWQTALVIFILLIFLFLFSQKVDLTNSDLGRHLTNGKIFFENGMIANTNLYSYTNSSFPVLNHHWLFGAMLYPIGKISGFVGISFFFLLLHFFAGAIVLYLTMKRAGFILGLILFLLALPLFSSRTEIRPEVFSLFFSVIYYLILDNSRSVKFLILIPLLQILWVNIHIYFPLGIFLTLSFLIAEIKLKPRLEFSLRGKRLLVTAVLATIANLLNPFFINGALYPLHIFNNYGFAVAENISPLKIEQFGMFLPSVYFKIFSIIFFLSLLYGFLHFIKNKAPSRNFIAHFLISVCLTGLALFAIRNLTLFAFLGTILSSHFLHNLAASNTLSKVANLKTYPYLSLLYLIIFGILVIINPIFWNIKKENFGFGLKRNNLSSLEFFKKNNISGPIFNNYDIGSYLIYGLYPNQKVFVDNRPEAYPSDFFAKTFIPMQESSEVWKKVDAKYNFNSIFFYKHDLTNFGRQFLISRTKDPEWSLVYSDNFALIFIKKNKNER